MSYWTDHLSLILGPDSVKHQCVLRAEGSSPLACLLITKWSIGKPLRLFQTEGELPVWVFSAVPVKLVIGYLPLNFTYFINKILLPRCLKLEGIRSMPTSSCVMTPALHRSFNTTWNCRGISSHFPLAQFLKTEMGLFVMGIIWINLINEFITNLLISVW